MATYSRNCHKVPMRDQTTKKLPGQKDAIKTENRADTDDATNLYHENTACLRPAQPPLSFLCVDHLGQPNPLVPQFLAETLAKHPTTKSIHANAPRTMSPITFFLVTKTCIARRACWPRNILPGFATFTMRPSTMHPHTPLIRKKRDRTRGN